MEIKIELDREEDGRWIADVIDLPGVVAYGATRNEAVSRAEAVAMRVLAYPDCPSRAWGGDLGFP